MGLHDFEKRLETIFESSFAKAARRGVEPAEIGRKAVREVTQKLLSGAKYFLAPNRINVSLSERDYDNLTPVLNSIKNELLILLNETAETSGFRFVGPLDVEILSDTDQRFGTVSVDAQFDEKDQFGEKRLLSFGQGQLLELAEATVTIGRLPGCTVVIEDPKVSRQHAEIRLVDGEVYLRDMGSTNGTYVNDAIVKGEQKLNDGDLIQIGRTKITYSVS